MCEEVDPIIEVLAANPLADHSEMPARSRIWHFRNALYWSVMPIK
jgi:hypothetical protein